MTLGLILASRLSAQGETVLVSGSTVVFGRGVGMVVQILVLAAQNSGRHGDLATATSSITLSRILGGAFSVAIFGSVLRWRFDGLMIQLSSSNQGQSLSIVEIVPGTLQGLEAGLGAAVAEVVSRSFGFVFLGGALVSATAVVVTLRIRGQELASVAPVDSPARD